MMFRTRVFTTALLAAAVTLAIAVALLTYHVRRNVADRIERSLISSARLAAATLSHRHAATPAELDAEADALGAAGASRVTFIAADGLVVGDSEVAFDALATLENHASRPEIDQARRDGLGVARRHSATVDADMLYVAVPVRNPELPQVSRRSARGAAHRGAASSSRPSGASLSPPPARLC